MQFQTAKVVLGKLPSADLLLSKSDVLPASQTKGQSIIIAFPECPSRGIQFPLAQMILVKGGGYTSRAGL